ncbi:reverse transcriptase domain-containing protein [Tanacetum coccineum]
MAPKKRTTRSTPSTPTTTISVTNEQLRALINQGVADALAARDADRSMNGDDSHNSGMGVRRTERVARECTYQDFMKCQPLFFKGTKGVVKFATCTLLGVALTWWNSHVRTVGHDIAYVMTCTDLKKKITDKYCPRNKIKKLEAELWNLKVKESDKIEKYVGGLPDMIHGSVMASMPKTMQEAIEMATELTDKKISVFAERQAENKRKLNNNNQAQQQLLKRQNVAQAYAAGAGERKDSAATNNQRTLTCYECGNQGHYRSDCLERKNRNHGNQAGGTGTHGMVLALGGGETDQDPNDIEDEIEA